MLYKIADFITDIKSDYQNVLDNWRPFRTSKEKEYEFSVTVEQSRVLKEKEVIGPEYLEGTIANTVALQQFADWLPLHNAFLLHSVLIDVEGEGVVFAAHSGTGKSTHMLLWQQLLGDKMTIVNGDKPFIRFFEDEPTTPYGYGTPWCGKEWIGINMRTPLKHICFIERAKENSCEKMEPSEAIVAIFNQVYMPKEPVAMANTIELINRLIGSCKLWKIKCNMDISAAQVAYNTIFNK